MTRYSILGLGFLALCYSCTPIHCSSLAHGVCWAFFLSLRVQRTACLLSPSTFWGPRLIARSPRLRRREKNLEPQKIDGLSIYLIMLMISIPYYPEINNLKLFKMTDLGSVGRCSFSTILRTLCWNHQDN